MWCVDHNKAQRKTTKFKKKGVGPYTVVGKINEFNYIIKKDDKKRTQVIHRNQLQRCYTQPIEVAKKDSSPRHKSSISKLSSTSFVAPSHENNQSSMIEVSQNEPEFDDRYDLQVYADERSELDISEIITRVQESTLSNNDSDHGNESEYEPNYYYARQIEDEEVEVFERPKRNVKPLSRYGDNVYAKDHSH